MDNRPHSRKKRIDNNEGYVEKHSFSSNKRSFNQSYNSRDYQSIKRGLNLLGSRSTGGFSIFTIIKYLIILYILYRVITFVLGGFSISNYDDINNYHTNNVGTYSGNYVTSEQTSTSEVNYQTSKNARDKFTTIYGNNKDEVTVMIYMIGTDLESQYRAATSDLQEITHADNNDNTNIIIETGGCSRWQNSVISNKTIERYRATEGGLERLETNIGNIPMTDPSTLSSFIKYCKKNYPANRYFLILWDHGGGSVTGYGYDEKFPNYGSMSPDMLAQALKNGGVKFDVVGFDACLMANLETAVAIEPYADYMIASEETEPGGGWYYKDFLSDLNNNKSINTLDLAKTIIDDYIDHSASNSELTLSVIDLGELVANINNPLKQFAIDTNDKLQSNNYQEIANARSNTKEFSKSSRLDQVDLVDLVENFNVDGSADLITAIKGAIKYNRSANIINAYGLSAYFPFSSLQKINQMVDIYEKIDMNEEYTNTIKSFATYASSGQIISHNNSSSSTSIFDILNGNYYDTSSSYSSNDIYSVLSDALTPSYSNSYSDYDGYGSMYGYDSYGDIFGGSSSWVDSSLLGGISDYFSRGNLVDQSKFQICVVDDQEVVSLSEEQWSLIDSVLLNMYIEYEDGYLDLGMDNVFSFNEYGDLIVDCDSTWLSINGHFVAYYMVSDEYKDDYNYKTVGYIPCYLNGERVDLIVNFTPEYEYGTILGAKKVYENSDTQIKGLIDIKEGDEIIFVGKFYTKDGEYIDEYQIGDPLIVEDKLELWNKKLSNDYVYTYCFNDIYGNKMWTAKRFS